MAAVFVLCLIPFLRASRSIQREPGLDEIHWIGQSYYFHLAFEKGEWSHPDWRLIPATQNPVIGKYIIGLGLHLNGQSITNLDWLGVYYQVVKRGWGEGRDRELREELMTHVSPAVREAAEHDQFNYSPQVLTTARAVMMLFGILSTVLMFVLCTQIMGRIPAFLAALIFALHPVIAVADTNVGVDILAIFFSLLAFLHFLLIQRRVWADHQHEGWIRTLVVAAGGASVGLAVGAKPNAMIIVVFGGVLAAAYLAAFVLDRTKALREQFLAMTLLLVVALVLFVVSNPVNFPNVVSGVKAGFVDAQRAVVLEQAVLPDPLTRWGQKLYALATMTSGHPVVFLLIIVAAGAQLTELRSWKERLPIAALWWSVAVTMVAVWLPFARPRYVLPVIAPSIIVLCLGIDRLEKKYRARIANVIAVPGAEPPGTEARTNQSRRHSPNPRFNGASPSTPSHLHSSFRGPSDGRRWARDLCCGRDPLSHRV